MAKSFRVFISYRRADAAGHAGRLFDRLADCFGQDNIFMDVDNIPLGSNFPQIIREAVSSSDVLLAIIGKQWFSSRLEMPDDFVRLELVTALERQIPIIPILVQGATMPERSAMPSAIAPLMHRNALELSDGRWSCDVGRLISVLRTQKRKRGERKSPTTKAIALPFLGRVKAAARTAYEVLILVVLGIVGAFGLYEMIGQIFSPEDAAPKLPIEMKADEWGKFVGLQRAAYFQRPIEAGSSIGLPGDSDHVGRICCFVKDSQGIVYLLTSNVLVEYGLGNSSHSRLTNLPWVLGNLISQPAWREGGEVGDEIATITKTLISESRSGAALARVSGNIKVSQWIRGVGAIRGAAQRVAVGASVRTLDKGPVVMKLEKVDSTASIGSPMGVPIGGLITLQGSLSQNNAGTPVVNEANELIGMVIGQYRGKTLVAPIRPIMQDLGVTLVVPERR